jgi:hypothetical protein
VDDVDDVADGVPAQLAPNGTTETGAAVTLTCAPVANAARYRFVIETIDAGGAAHAYFTYEKSAPAATFYPQTAHVTYRFTVQAQSNGTWSAASAPASFIRP